MPHFEVHRHERIVPDAIPRSADVRFGEFQTVDFEAGVDDDDRRYGQFEFVVDGNAVDGRRAHPQVDQIVLLIPLGGIERCADVSRSDRHLEAYRLARSKVARLWGHRQFDRPSLRGRREARGQREIRVHIALIGHVHGDTGWQARHDADACVVNVDFRQEELTGRDADHGLQGVLRAGALRGEGHGEQLGLTDGGRDRDVHIGHKFEVAACRNRAGVQRPRGGVRPTLQTVGGDVPVVQLLPGVVEPEGQQFAGAGLQGAVLGSDQRSSVVRENDVKGRDLNRITPGGPGERHGHGDVVPASKTGGVQRQEKKLRIGRVVQRPRGERRDGVGREGLGRPATQRRQDDSHGGPDVLHAVVPDGHRQVVNAQRKSSHGLAGTRQRVRGRERGALEVALHVE